MMYEFHDQYGMLRGMGYGYLIILLLIIVTIIFIVYKLFSSNNHNQSSRRNMDLDELNKKFVNGEISEEEYLRKKDLMKK
jgi:putative membrane protein